MREKFLHLKDVVDGMIESRIRRHMAVSTIRSVDDWIVAIGMIVPAFMFIGGMLPAAMRSNCGIPRLACYPSTPENDRVVILGMVVAVAGVLLAFFACWLHARFTNATDQCSNREENTCP